MNKRSSFRLSTLMAISLTVLSILSISLVGGLQTYRIFDLQKQAVFNLLSLDAAAASAKVSNFINTTISVLQTSIRFNHSELTGPDRRRHHSILTRLLYSEPSIRNITLVNSLGEETDKISRFVVYNDKDLSSIAGSILWQSVKEKQLYMKPVRFSSNTEEPIVTVALPVLNTYGDFRGALIADINLKFIWNLMASLDIGESGVAYVIDEAGRLIAHTNMLSFRPGEDWSSRPAIDLINRPDNQKIVYGSSSEKVMAVAVDVLETDWNIIFELPVKEGFKGAVRNLIMSLMLVFIVMFIAAITGVFLARRLASPLRLLQDSAGWASEGNFDHRIKLEGGKKIGVYEVEHLVTAFNEMLEQIQLRKSEEEQQKIHKLESIGVLAGGIAHDFNNLLAALRNNISLTKKGLDRKSNTHQNLESADKILHRAFNLTQQLLTFSSGGAPVKKTVSIFEIINESAEFVMKGSNIKCEYNIADNTWPIDVDEGQINQVIRNLILNAVQSMPKGGTIRIRTENSELASDASLPLCEGRYIKIAIQDQGIGITEDDLQKIFDPYFTTKVMGRGLGLSITYSIIKNHDGHISVESEIGTGTTFTIFLPASNKQREIIETAEDAFADGHGKVLLMDDEEVIRESLGDLLATEGYEIECAIDGDEAIALYKKALGTSKPFDAVILDLTIRDGMGGKESVRKLLEIDPNVKAIVSSGYSNDPVIGNFRDYGFCGIFTKGNTTKKLIKTLHEIIEG